MGLIGTILAVVGGIALFVFWIMTLIKQFKSNDTLWGVLTIFFAILAPIWCFMKGHKSLGMKFVIAFVLYLIGFALLGGSGALVPPQM
ncbi:MAG: hypothetical protein P1U86_03690 [Verrucomicrobiales bacterium]|nr:hypothetical protein [Verrucomicrobiales bacterium]